MSNLSAELNSLVGRIRKAAGSWYAHPCSGSSLV